MILNALGTLIEKLSSIAILFVAFATVIVTFQPKVLSKIEQKKWVRFITIAIGVLVVYGQYVDKNAGNQLSDQVTKLMSANNSAPVEELRTEMREGFNKVLSALHGGKPVPSHADPLKPFPETMPYPLEKSPFLGVTQKDVKSTDPSFPFSTQLVVNSNNSMPIFFGLEFESAVDKVDFFVAGQGVQLMSQTGFLNQEKTIAFIKAGYPQLLSGESLVIYVFSKRKIVLKRISPLKININNKKVEFSS